MKFFLITSKSMVVRNKKQPKMQVLSYKIIFYCEAFTAVKIYPEFHKASHSFAEEKSRTANDKQLFGMNGHKCDGFI